MAITDPIKARFEKYLEQKRYAKHHGIGWDLTFLEWCFLWDHNRLWEKRGRKRGQYLLARIDKDGIFELKNVHIIKVDEHLRDILLLQEK